MGHVSWLIKYYISQISSALVYPRKYGWLNYIKVTYFRRKAARHYLRYKEIANRYSCGHTMLMEVSYSARREHDKFKVTMAKLKLIDRNFPEQLGV